MENKNSSLLEKDDFDLSDILTPEELAEIERAAEAELGFSSPSPLPLPTRTRL